MATYKIFIKKYETTESEETEYRKVADSGNPRDGGTMWAYVPTGRTKIETAETEVYQQDIDAHEYDSILTNVVKAVNGLLP